MSKKEVLEAIVTFWEEGDAPLSPYALITDNDLTIYENVKNALKVTDVPQGTENLAQWYANTREGKPDAPKKIEGLHIEGRRWFQRTYGNTYHRTRIYANGSLLWDSGKVYGYGDHWLQTAVEYFVREGYLPKSERGYCSSLVIREVLGGSYSVSDVAREKDL